MRLSKTQIYIASISLLLFIIILLSLYSPQVIHLDNYVNSIMPNFQNNLTILISKIINIAFDTKLLLVITFVLAILLWLKRNKNPPRVQGIFKVSTGNESQQSCEVLNPVATNKKESLFFMIVMLAGAGATYIIKEIIQRARPLNILITENNSSFPSGHATMAVIFFGTLVYLILEKNLKKMKKTLITIAVLLIILTGLSRLILNAHWLTDVLAGFILGLAILSIGILLKGVLEKK